MDELAREYRQTERGDPRHAQIANELSALCLIARSLSGHATLRLAVKLRDHPLMSHHGVPNWPPVWTQARAKDTKVIRGEIGILKYVDTVNTAGKKFHLLMQYAQWNYVGTLLFDDLTFCRQIAALLQQHVGRPIKEIGDLDVSDTL
jgi:hypothetical protein